jgi:hypothetical protein
MTIFKYLIVFVFVIFSISAQATQTAYAWTIDWSGNTQDEGGVIIFDDFGETELTRGWSWPGFGEPRIPKNFVNGLPFAFLEGSVYYKNGGIERLQGCSVAFSFCSRDNIVLFGWTSISFFGGSTRATYNSALTETAPCFGGGGIQFRPASCFLFENGITTFSPLGPIPEPSTSAILLLGLGIFGIVFSRRRV